MLYNRINSLESMGIKKDPMPMVWTHNYASLLFLVTVFSQTLLALVGGHFVFLSFFTTWHNAFLVLPRHVGAGLTIHLF
jgi:hypothetical protein